MSVNHPFFSVIIPTYNRAQLIGKTIASVLSQTFGDYELIVVDDGGEDSTEEVVKQFGNDKIKYYKKENGERGAARNYGVQKASGSYITFLDSDDILYDNHLQNAYKCLQQLHHPECFAAAYEIKEVQTGKVLVKAFSSRKPIINDALLDGNFLSCFGVFLKKELWDELKFEEDRKFAGTEDWLLWLQIAARYPIYYSNTITGAMMEHDSRSVLSFSEESLLYRVEFLKQKLENDAPFLKRYGPKMVTRVYAHMLSYTSLHLAMSSKKKEAVRYWLKAVKTSAHELMTRRSLAITKKVLFS